LDQDELSEVFDAFIGESVRVETVIKAARSWISDCRWGDLDEEDIATLSIPKILAGVQSHYGGGLIQFLQDAGLTQSIQDGSN
jgi:hypothetical protein